MMDDAASDEVFLAKLCGALGTNQKLCADGARSALNQALDSLGRSLRLEWGRRPELLCEALPHSKLRTLSSEIVSELGTDWILKSDALRLIAQKRCAGHGPNYSADANQLTLNWLPPLVGAECAVGLDASLKSTAHYAAALALLDCGRTLDSCGLQALYKQEPPLLPYLASACAAVSVGKVPDRHPTLEYFKDYGQRLQRGEKELMRMALTTYDYQLRFVGTANIYCRLGGRLGTVEIMGDAF